MFLLPAVPGRRRFRLALAVAAVVAGGLVAPAAAAPAAADEVIGASSVGSPYEGAVLTPGVPVIIAGPAIIRGGPPASVEVSVDGGESWTDAEIGENGYFWSLVYTPTEPGELTIVARAATAYDSVTGDPVHVTVGSTAEPVAVGCSCEFQIPSWRGDAVPDYDGNPVEVGLRFRTDRDVAVTGLVVWRFPFMDSIIGRLWSEDGTLLAQQVRPAGTDLWLGFSHPVPIQAGHTSSPRTTPPPATTSRPRTTSKAPSSSPRSRRSTTTTAAPASTTTATAAASPPTTGTTATTGSSPS